MSTATELEGWGQPDGMLGPVEADRIAPPPAPITDESTWEQHVDCEWSWVAPGQADEHAVCPAHGVRFQLPADGFSLPVDPFDAGPQTGRGVSW